MDADTVLDCSTAGGVSVRAGLAQLKIHKKAGMTLVTNNTEEFRLVEGLRLEDWTRA